MKNENKKNNVDLENLLISLNTLISNQSNDIPPNLIESEKKFLAFIKGIFQYPQNILQQYFDHYVKQELSPIKYFLYSLGLYQKIRYDVTKLKIWKEESQITQLDNPYSLLSYFNNFDTESCYQIKIFDDLFFLDFEKEEGLVILSIGRLSFAFKNNYLEGIEFYARDKIHIYNKKPSDLYSYKSISYN